MRFDLIVLQVLFWSVFFGRILRQRTLRFRLFGRGPPGSLFLSLLGALVLVFGIVWLISVAMDIKPVGVIRGGAASGGSSEDELIPVRMYGQTINMSLDIVKMHYEEQQNAGPLYEAEYNQRRENLTLPDLEALLEEAAAARERFKASNLGGQVASLTPELLEFYGRIMQHKENVLLDCFIEGDTTGEEPPRTLKELNERYKSLRSKGRKIDAVRVVDANGNAHRMTEKVMQTLNGIADHTHVFEVKADEGNEQDAKREVKRVPTTELEAFYNRYRVYARCSGVWREPTYFDMAYFENLAKSLAIPPPMEIFYQRRWQRLTKKIVENLGRRPPVDLGYIFAFTNLAGYCFGGLTPGPDGAPCLPHIYELHETWTIDGLWPLEPVKSPPAQQRTLEELNKEWKSMKFAKWREALDKGWIKVTDIPVDRPVHEFFIHAGTFPAELEAQSFRQFIITAVDFFQRTLGNEGFLVPSNSILTGSTKEIPKERVEDEVRLFHPRKPMLLCRQNEKNPGSPKILTGFGLCFNPLKSPINCPGFRDTCGQSVYIMPKESHKAKGYPFSE